MEETETPNHNLQPSSSSSSQNPNPDPKTPTEVSQPKESEKVNPNLILQSSTSTTTAQNPDKPPSRPKRFFKSQIPESILSDPALNAAVALLPSNYNFEVHKSLWRILSSGAKRVALQLPEGLLMYSLILCDVFKSFAPLDDCFVLGDVTYGACCVDDFSASALDADLLIHYGHSCLIPIDLTKIPSLYVFVEIRIDVDHLVDTIKLNFDPAKRIVLAGTIQFSAAIRAAKIALAELGFQEVIIPQSKPLSAGEILGCTSPRIPLGKVDAVVFVADGRFHLEAFMIANPGIGAFRYDPYSRVLSLEEYDHEGMKDSRKNAILRSREARSWGIVLGTLGRQGNPRILDRLQKRMAEKGFVWTVVLMSEISPPRIALFGDSVDAWIQIACPRLSIDWGEAFPKPLLTPFEAEIALGFIQGWWEKTPSRRLRCGDARTDDLSCKNGSCCGTNYVDGSNAGGECKMPSTDYPMDYYAQDGGEWNCSYSKKPSPVQRKQRPPCG